MLQNNIKGFILARVEISFINAKTSDRHAQYANLSKCLRKLADLILRAIFEKKKNPKHSIANTEITPVIKNFRSSNLCDNGMRTMLSMLFVKVRHPTHFKHLKS